MLERRRRYLIIRVDRADLSKNVLRGFTAFDTFLTQHPEFREQVTFIAHLQPSRQDVPEYAEYRERIEALVAVVNHRHGTTDWMPIDLRIYENFADAVARYKHYDLLMVNAIFDGMNLVAKEAPAVNTRDGVLMLSENTGSHQELWDWVISVNPFDIQEQSDAIYRALTMEPEQKAELGPGPARHHLRPQPRRLGRRPARRHRESPRRADFLLAAGGEIRPPGPWRGDGGRADQVARGRAGGGDRRRRPARAAPGAEPAARARAAAAGQRTSGCRGRGRRATAAAARHPVARATEAALAAASATERRPPPRRHRPRSTGRRRSSIAVDHPNRSPSPRRRRDPPRRSRPEPAPPPAPEYVPPPLPNRPGTPPGTPAGTPIRAWRR